MKTSYYSILVTILFLSCQPTKPKTSSSAGIYSFELEGMSVDDLQQKMQSGELSSHAIVQLYLDRIQLIDKNGTGVNSIIEINPDALTIADSLDVERKNNKVRGPLHGIPVLLKDNIDTDDKMHTTAGSLALGDNIASN